MDIDCTTSVPFVFDMAPGLVLIPAKPFQFLPGIVIEMTGAELPNGLVECPSEPNACTMLHGCGFPINGILKANNESVITMAIYPWLYVMLCYNRWIYVHGYISMVMLCYNKWL